MRQDRRSTNHCPQPIGLSVFGPLGWAAAAPEILAASKAVPNHEKASSLRHAVRLLARYVVTHCTYLGSWTGYPKMPSRQNIGQAVEPGSRAIIAGGGARHL